MGTLIGKHKVYFIYDTKDVEISKDTTIEKKTTECVITEDVGRTVPVEDIPIIARATVSRNHNDPDIKSAGRLYAFRKAVDLIEDKTLKASLWKGFKENIKMNPGTKLPTVTVEEENVRE